MDQDVSDDLIEAGHGYEALFVPALFEAWTRHLVEGAGVGDGSHVLDADDETFDCVISQFGMMFFEDRRKSAKV
jgi:phospholipid N-methyltransferase